MAGMSNAPILDKANNKIFELAMFDNRTDDLVRKSVKFSWDYTELSAAICMRLLHELKDK